MRQIWRLLAVMILALVLGALAIVSSDRPSSLTATSAPPAGPAGGAVSCMGAVASDPAYVADVETEPAVPTTDGTTYRVLVTRDGREVSDARVCLILDMPGMNMERGQETAAVGPGRYETRLELPMAGRWVGEVRVAVPGGGAGAVVPVVFDVE